MRRRILLAVLLASLLAPASWADAMAVEGTDRALVRPPRGIRFEDYENAGYRMQLRGGRLEVTVNASPLEDATLFLLPQRRGGVIEEVARAVTSDVETRFEAVSRILAWVDRNIEYRLDRAADQSALEVLDRRSGFCTGISRLTVALLEAVEIPAREVAGYVIEEGGGFHRWVEIHYPERGWVFSDPVRSHHFVPATYLRLASSEVVAAELDEGQVIERIDRVLPVDLYPMANEGILALRNRPRQLAGTVRVEVEGEPEGKAILEGRGRRWSADLGPQGSTFVGLAPGEYTLRLLLAGRPDRVRNLRLEGRVLSTVLLTAN